MKWLRRLLSKDKYRAPATSPGTTAITTEKLEQVFQWSWLHGPIGLGTNQSDFEQATGLKGYFGSGIDISREAKIFTIKRDTEFYRVGETVSTPPFIKFSNAPEFAYLSVNGDAVEIRYCRNAGAPFTYCAVSRDLGTIRRIEIIFDFWYRHLGLPISLAATKPVRRQVDRSNKLKLIRGYINDGTTEYFHDVFAENDPVVWIDHREADDDIVANVADVLRLEALSAEETETRDRVGYRISYGRKLLDVPYPQPYADRDSTIVALNRILQPGYEIRWCVASDGSDTLAFLPLAKRQWAALEKSNPEQVKRLFRKISPGSVMFG